MPNPAGFRIRLGPLAIALRKTHHKHGYIWLPTRRLRAFFPALLPRSVLRRRALCRFSPPRATMETGEQDRPRAVPRLGGSPDPPARSRRVANHLRASLGG